MAGKQPGTTGPASRVRTPSVAGPAAAAGPPILARILGPQQAAANANFDQAREVSANTVGTIASIISNIFYPGTGGLAGIAANRTVREQYNTFGGRPFFESTEEPLKDWTSIVAGTAGGALGGLAGGAAAGAGAGGQVATQAGYTAVEGATGAADVAGGVGGLTSTAVQTGTTVGSEIGGRAGAYAGGVARDALYGGGRRSKYKYDPYQRRYVYGGA